MSGDVPDARAAARAKDQSVTRTLRSIGPNQPRVQRNRRAAAVVGARAGGSRRDATRARRTSMRRVRTWTAHSAARGPVLAASLAATAAPARRRSPQRRSLNHLASQLRWFSQSPHRQARQARWPEGRPPARSRPLRPHRGASKTLKVGLAAGISRMADPKSSLAVLATASTGPRARSRGVRGALSSPSAGDGQNLDVSSPGPGPPRP
jgi:hypothetical protein